MVKFTCLKCENEYYSCVRKVHKTSRIKIIIHTFFSLSFKVRLSFSKMLIIYNIKFGQTQQSFSRF